MMNARVVVMSDGDSARIPLVPKQKYGRNLIKGEPQDISSTIVKLLSTNRRRKSMMLTLLKREYALQLTDRSGGVRLLYRPLNQILRVPVQIGDRLRLAQICAGGEWHDLAPEKSFEFVFEGLERPDDPRLVESDTMAASDREIIVGMARNLARFGPLRQEVEQLDQKVKTSARGTENGYDPSMKEVRAVDGPMACWLSQGDMGSSVRHLSNAMQTMARQNASVSAAEFNATKRQIMQKTQMGQLASQFLGN